MSELKLYTAERCPYAQRTRLVLAEKGLEHELIEIDLDDKPAWFAEVSPYGKVPVLVCGGRRIYESSIINAFIDEAYPEPPLMPSDPGRRAEARIWIDFADTRLAPTFYRLLLAQEPARQAALLEVFHGLVLFMEREGLERLGGGPYWLGPALSLVDVAFYPHVERFPALAHYRGFRLPDACRRLRAWSEAMGERASVGALSHPADYYVRNLRAYADGTADGVTAREMRAS